MAGAESLALGAAAWLLTWLLHGTVLLGGALLVTRAAGDRVERLREALWRTALFGPIVTATVQLLAPMPSVRGLLVGAGEQGILLRTVLLSDSAGPAVSHGMVSPALGALAWATVLIAAVAAARGVSLMAARRRWRRSLGERTADAALSARATRLADGWAVRVTLAPGAVTPMALGRREICLPARAPSELAPGELDAVLLHEIAHLRRRDPLWLGAAAAVQRVLWIQPLQRIAVAELRMAAEARCDAWALSRRAGPLELAGALARVSEWMIGAAPVGVAAAVGSSDSPALARVRRILDFDPGRVPAGSRGRGLALGATLVLGATALLPGFSPVKRGWALDPAAPAYVISAVDDAGPFTVTVQRGRVTGVTMDGRALDRSFFRQVADRVVVSDRAGRVVLELHLTPEGGMRWTSRPRPAPTPS